MSKYGIMYKGSYWTGSTPAEAVKTLLNNFPRFRFKKNDQYIWVAEIEEIVSGLWISTFSPFHKFTREQVKEIKLTK